MAESIFKIVDGEPVILAFEKHYLKLVLSERIAEENKHLAKMEADEEWSKQELNQAILPLYKHFISDLEIVLKRVEATPVIS